MSDGQPENKWGVYLTTDDRDHAIRTVNRLWAEESRRCELWTVHEMHMSRHPLAPRTAFKYAVVAAAYGARVTNT